MKATKQQRRYWDWLATEHGCVVTRQTPATIHHVHGGSMTSVIGIKGTGLKTSNWLVLPLASYLHVNSNEAIDGALGVLSWEKRYGNQLYWLAQIADKACSQLQLDVFALAGVTRPDIIDKYPEIYHV